MFLLWNLGYVQLTVELTLFRLQVHLILIFYDYPGLKKLGEAVQWDDICPWLCALWPPSRQCLGQQNWWRNTNSPAGSWIVSGRTVDILSFINSFQLQVILSVTCIRIIFKIYLRLIVMPLTPLIVFFTLSFALIMLRYNSKF